VDDIDPQGKVSLSLAGDGGESGGEGPKPERREQNPSRPSSGSKPREDSRGGSAGEGHPVSRSSSGETGGIARASFEDAFAAELAETSGARGRALAGGGAARAAGGGGRERSRRRPGAGGSRGRGPGDRH
jgi:hypothetical protein